MRVGYVEAEHPALIGSWDGTLFLIQVFRFRMSPRGCAGLPRLGPADLRNIHRGWSLAAIPVDCSFY
jgi:hypothetical protein